MVPKLAVSLNFEMIQQVKSFNTNSRKLHNAGLMNAILALSCHHSSITHDSSTPKTADENDSIQYYYQTLHYVQKAMRYTSYQSSKELIATTLIISTYEMLSGSQKDWERHLQGVFWILRSQNINVEIEAVESAVWWEWLRQDIWAAFRNKRKTYTAWSPKKSYDIMNPYEIAGRALWHLSQVVNFCSTPTVSTYRSEVSERFETADKLLQILDEWLNNLPVEFKPLPASAADTSNVFQPLLIYPSCYGKFYSLKYLYCSDQLSSSLGLAIQVHYVCRILLSFQTPSVGGLADYMDRMKSVESWIHIVCGVGMTLTDGASSILSSQCIFIGKQDPHVANSVSFIADKMLLAGMFCQDRREREEVLRLLAGCRSRTGWPANPLQDELKEIWQKPLSSGGNAPKFLASDV